MRSQEHFKAMNRKKHRFSLALALGSFLAGLILIGLAYAAAGGSLDAKITPYVVSAFETVSFSSRLYSSFSIGIFAIAESLFILAFRRKKRLSMVISVPSLAVIYGTLLVYFHILNGIASPAFLMSRIDPSRSTLILVCVLLELLLFIALLVLISPLDRKLAKRAEHREKQEKYAEEMAEAERREAEAEAGAAEEEEPIPPAPLSRKEMKQAEKAERKAAKEQARVEKAELKAQKKAEKAQRKADKEDEVVESFTTQGVVYTPQTPPDPGKPVEFPEFDDIPAMKTIRPGRKEDEAVLLKESLIGDAPKEPDEPPLRESNVFASIKEEVEREEDVQEEAKPEKRKYDFSAAQSFTKGGMLEATLEAMFRNEQKPVEPPKGPIIGYDDEPKEEEKPRHSGGIAPSNLSPDHPRYKMFEALQKKPSVSHFPSKSFQAAEDDEDDVLIEEEPAEPIVKPVQPAVARPYKPAPAPVPAVEEDEEDEPVPEPEPVQQQPAADGHKNMASFDPFTTPQKPRKAPEAAASEPEEEPAEQQDELELIVGIGGLQSNELGYASINRRKKVKYLAPSTDILYDYPAVSTEIDEETRRLGDIIINTLKEFHITATLDSIVKGPTVTMFQINPAEGTAISRIASRETDLSYNLGGVQIRILAPVPGRRAVGIEVPNAKRAVIGFKDMLAEYGKNPDYKKMKVPMILGRTITGEAIVYDVAKAPHMLIAGTTGSGKSVCINTFICTAIYTRSPKDLRFIMVDPKVVELTIYNGIPHLLTPVITEAKKAVKALEWLVEEMERRYKMLSNYGVRNIEGLNEKIKEEHIPAEKLPYIVLIMDEFADLMTVVGKEIETNVSRLAAKARAAGIHLILATQRPSSDVITGTIKNNFPARIAFAASSAINSRVILDEGGAESLLGKGDMLLLDSSKPGLTRIQGAFLSDKEVDAIVGFEKANSTPDYLVEEIFEEPPEPEESDDDVFDEGDSDEDLYERAKQICYEKKVASASFLQRRMKISYNRAARMIDRMEEDGIIGPPNGSKPREIICYK